MDVSLYLEAPVRRREARNPISAKVIEDGVLELRIECRAGDVEEISERISQLASDCEDNAFGVHERLHDLEVAEERSPLGIASPAVVRRFGRQPKRKS
jgi:hypothetical protein